MSPSPTSPLPELDELHRLIDAGGGHLDHRVAAQVEVRGAVMPVPVVSMGSRDPLCPAVGFFAGVHGLERIGVQVVLAYLGHLVQRLRWDEGLQDMLQRVRLVFMPLVNPGGLWLGTRANPAGVDLMRNAPVEAEEAVPLLVGGQRWSPALPWYRGSPGAAMEAESHALCDVVQAELLARPFSLALDCHSGFGLLDRVWFPFACSRRPVPHLADLQALASTFEQSHPHHRYVFEPQSLQYLTHGDLWDHLYLQSLRRPAHHAFLPLTLEMGSWLWVKKNPRQLFSRHGIFNPLLAHRQARVLRQHLALLEFMARAGASHHLWRPLSQDDRHAAHAAGLQRWYPPSGQPLQRAP